MNNIKIVKFSDNKFGVREEIDCMGGYAYKFYNLSTDNLLTYINSDNCKGTFDEAKLKYDYILNQNNDIGEEIDINDYMNYLNYMNCKTPRKNLLKSIFRIR